MKYPIAEKFKAPQGEGVFTGVPMAFIRFVGCSVGKTICTACDTDFDRMLPALGGGQYTQGDLHEWVGQFVHVCLTGGEPMDRNLQPLVVELLSPGTLVEMIHIETSGTRPLPDWVNRYQLQGKVWVTVCPKPGYLEDTVRQADEVKVILDGLGDGPGWPTVADAVHWVEMGKVVYVQPRNRTMEIDRIAMSSAIDIVMQHPRLRLSAQLHKYLRTR